MSSLKTYRISYHFQGEPRHFLQRDTHMTEADAWYYAALHSGIGLLYGLPGNRDKAQDLRQHAEMAGISRLTYIEVI